MTVTWQSGLEPVDVQRVRQLLADSTAVDGVPALSGHVVEALGSADHRYLLVARADRLAAVAVAAGNDPAELVVHQDFRRQGIGRELVEAALAQSGLLWAHGHLPAAQQLARALGLRQRRVLLQMRRSLPAPSAEVVVPQGFRIRTFVPGQDDDSFLQVNAKAFAWHPEQGRLDADGLAHEMAQEWFDPAGFFVAVREHPDFPQGQVAGFHWTKVHPVDPTPSAADPDRFGGTAAGAIGEVYVLGVEPGVRGLGRPLTAVGLQHLADRGLESVLLYVEGDNNAALRLYSSLGFEIAVTDVVFAP